MQSFELVGRCPILRDGAGDVGVCVGNSLPNACAGSDAAAGALSICFFVQNGMVPSLQPGTYPITTGGFSISQPITTSASIQECMVNSQGPTWVPENAGEMAMGSVTLTVITSSSVQGSASITFPSGDEAQLTFDAVVTGDGFCP